ncbi:MAG: hypothetical protein JRI36_12140 [Deltaproteobacteria bacterium]|nr:hypothetical protein [Deltaproteobacteria bacterium]
MSLLTLLQSRNQEQEEQIDPGFFDERMDQAIEDLNQAGICLMDYPPSTRHRAFLIEQELSEAANKGDRARFLELLKRWRGCFH